MKIPYVFKKCTKCGRWLVANTFNFYKKKGGKYGLTSQCKECHKVYNKKWSEDNEKHYAESIKNNNEEHPILYKKCTKCGRVLVANTDNFHKCKTGKYGLEGRCKECHSVYDKERGKKYREENKEKITKCMKKYYEENKKEILKQKKRYYEENKEYNKKYREEHKEAIAEYNKKYRNTPQGQVVLFNSTCKRRQREEQQGNGITKDQWLEMMKFFSFKCAYSGIPLKKGDNMTVDHIAPLVKGGAHEIWNCVPMDKSLNSSKHDKDMPEWYFPQDFFDFKRLDKIYEWCKYAYNKWGKDEIQQTI